jgi:hypothetical protein
MKTTILNKNIALVLAAAMGMLDPLWAHAHCDTLDGPVVAAARVALERNDVTPVLKWVNKESETEIRRAFAKTQAVRAQGSIARELADEYFFETLVRVHRAGEGEPFAGLKPAGTGVAPTIAKADEALKTGSVVGVVKLVSDEATAGIRQRFARVQEKQKHAEDSVEAGREYVAAYVDYIHYVEELHQSAASPTEDKAKMPEHEGNQSQPHQQDVKE